MNDIKLLTGAIEQEAREKADSIKSEAEHETRRILKEERIHIQKKRNRILDDYKHLVDEMDRQARAELRAKSGQLMLCARQDIIEETIIAAQELFAGRGEKEDTELLLRIFDRCVADAGGTVPVVLVPESRLDAARSALGPDVAVEASDIKHGFILSFEHYNVNYDTAARFEFMREELEELAAVYLFDGDQNGEA